MIVICDQFYVATLKSKEATDENVYLANSGLFTVLDCWLMSTISFK